MRISIPLILLIVFAMMFVGQSLYTSDLEDNEIRDIYNFTESYLVWNYSYTYNDVRNVGLDNSINIPAIKMNRISRIMNSFVDFIGITTMEGSKYLIEFGYSNPQYDFEYFLTLIKYYFIFLVICLLIPILIPLIALGYLLIMGVHKLILFVKKRWKQK